MAPSVICWIQISCADIKRAVKFYQEVFEFSIREGDLSKLDEDPRVIHFDFKGTDLEEKLTGGFVKIEASRFESHKPMGETLYFYADDLEAAMERVRKAGGQVAYERIKVDEGGWAAGFLDTEGNRHGVYTSNPAK